MLTRSALIVKDELHIENPCCQCLGTGKIKCLVCDGAGRMLDSSLLDVECLKCRGAGPVTCLECSGWGISLFMQFDHQHSHIAPRVAPQFRVIEKPLLRRKAAKLGAI